jgi:MFS family permease
VLWLGSIAFFALGIVLVLLGVHQADMARDLALDLSASGLLGALLSLAFGVALTATGPLSDRVPRRPLFVAATALAGFALIAVDDGISHARLAAHLILLGLGGGCYVTLFNAAVIDRYRERAAPALAIMHASTTAGAASGPWLIALGQSALGRDWRHTFHALGALYLCLALLGSAFALPRAPMTRDSRVPPHDVAASQPRRRWSRPLLALMIVGFGYVGVETGLTLFAIPWADSQGHGADAGRSAISAFWLGLLCGRLLLVARRPTPSAASLVAGGALGTLVIAAALAWSWPPAIAMGGAGFALGAVYPTMIALTGHHFATAGTALGLVAGAGACGGFALPWLGGVVGDALGARYAVGLLGGSTSLIAVGALVLGRGRVGR